MALVQRLRLTVVYAPSSEGIWTQLRCFECSLVAFVHVAKAHFSPVIAPVNFVESLRNLRT